LALMYSNPLSSCARLYKLKPVTYLKSCEDIAGVIGSIFSTRRART
jgi:hypothetical protein